MIVLYSVLWSLFFFTIIILFIKWDMYGTVLVKRKVQKSVGKTFVRITQRFNSQTGKYVEVKETLRVIDYNKDQNKVILQYEGPSMFSDKKVNYYTDYSPSLFCFKIKYNKYKEVR